MNTSDLIKTIGESAGMFVACILPVLIPCSTTPKI